MEPGLIVLLISSVLIVFVLLIDRSTGKRSRHGSQEEFSPPSALKRIVYSRPACAEAVGVYKTHSDQMKAKQHGCGLPRNSST
jgi:hypothetical protein